MGEEQEDTVDWSGSKMEPTKNKSGESFLTATIKRIEKQKGEITEKKLEGEYEARRE